MEEKGTKPTPSEPKQLGMDELSFFVQMVKFLIDDADPIAQERFWLTLYKHCPQLLDAIKASFTGEHAHITFTRSITSAAFSTDDDRRAENAAEEGSCTTE